MKLFDSHCHLDDERFNLDRDELIEQLKIDGVARLVSAGYSLKSSIKAIELAKKYNFIYATIGISPNDIPENEKELMEQINGLKNLFIKNEKIVAIGEIGLDYHWNTENKGLQKKAFIEQIKLANELELPIQIHTRDAVMDTIDILKNN